MQGYRNSGRVFIHGPCSHEGESDMEGNRWTSGCSAHGGPYSRSSSLLSRVSKDIRRSLKIQLTFILHCRVLWVGIANVIDYSVKTDFDGSLVLQILANSMILSPIGCRMLINMRDAGERGFNAGTTYQLSAVSAIDFNHEMDEFPETQKYKGKAPHESSMYSSGVAEGW